jgi:hypothetical protein
MTKRRVQQESFVVRVWREPDRPDWRGWVQHTRSGDSATLQSLGELIAFIESRTADPVKEEQRGLK